MHLNIKIYWDRICGAGLSRQWAKGYPVLNQVPDIRPASKKKILAWSLSRILCELYELRKLRLLFCTPKSIFYSPVLDAIAHWLVLPCFNPLVAGFNLDISVFLSNWLTNQLTNLVQCEGPGSWWELPIFNNLLV